MKFQREARQDAIYWERILRWNKHSDSMLLTFLDVDSQFMLEEGPRQRDRHFLEAIHTLQQLKTTFTPVQKLAVVGDMFKAITESREGVTWSMDTLLPVCMYVVVRARVLQLGAELAMLQDLMETHLFKVQFLIIFTSSNLIHYIYLTPGQRRVRPRRSNSLFGSDLYESP